MIFYHVDFFWYSIYVHFLNFREISESEAGESAPLQFENPSYHSDDLAMDGQAIAMTEKSVVQTPSDVHSSDEEA